MSEDEDSDKNGFNPERDSLDYGHTGAELVLKQRKKDTARILKLEKYKNQKELFYSKSLLDNLLGDLKAVNADIRDFSNMAQSEKWDYYLTLREEYLGVKR